MWDFFIKNNRFAYLFLIALIGIGTYSLLSIPRESAPEVVIPVGVVTTTLPGAPAADIESLITNEMERGLSSLENVNNITSVSREGVSSITVEFSAQADLDESISDLKDEIDRITPELPADANEPRVSEIDFVNQPILTLVVSANYSDFELTELANAVEKEIESVAGVSRVETSGVRDREVSVIVNQEALLRFNLSINEVVSAIERANRTVPIGQIVNNGVSYNVAFEGDVSMASEIANIPVANRGTQPIFLSEIAVVEDGLAPATSISRLSVDNQPSVSAINFDVFKQSGGDITRTAAAVNERVAELQEPGEMLADVTTATVLDSGELIQSDLLQLTTSGLQTVTLVILLLVLAIGWREGLLAGAAIPLSFLFGFIGLYFSGNTINFLSLFSLILGIGILVDSAIVVVEGINRKMKDNPEIDKTEAAVSVIKDFSAPLISGTLTTVSMFVGLFVVSGVTGQFIASIPFTLIFLLLSSLFVALAILPLIGATFLHRHNRSAWQATQTAFAYKLENWYKAKLAPYLDNQVKQNHFLSLIIAGLVFAIFLTIDVFAGVLSALLVYLAARWSYAVQTRKNWRAITQKVIFLPLAVASIAVAVLATSAVFPSTNLVKVVFFEQTDADYVIVEIEQPEGTVKEVTDIAVRRVEELLFAVPEFESYTVTVGSGSNFGSGGTGEKFANIFISLHEDRERTSTEIVEDLRNQFVVFNDFDVTVDQPSDGPPTGAAIVVKFLGENLNDISDLATAAAARIRSIDGAINVETSTNNNNTEFVFNLDRDRAAALGLDPFTISQTARAAVFGAEATSLTTLTDDIDVVVRLNISNDPTPTAARTNVTDITALSNISIPTPTGPVPLSSLVSISLRESSATINHESGQRVVSVTADVRDGANAREIQSEALDLINSELTIGSDVTISTGGGETEESNEAFLELFLALIVGVGLMVAVLTLQFNSYLHMRYVLSILPYSLIGIMIGLAVTGNSLSFPSIMGFIALSGIVVNNSILLIDMMNQLRRSNPAMPIREVVLTASGNRIRPILLTTITTVIGMIPLALAGDLWAPLAYAVMFGIVFSVFITLVLIPIIYYKKPGAVKK